LKNFIKNVKQKYEDLILHAPLKSVLLNKSKSANARYCILTKTHLEWYKDDLAVYNPLDTIPASDFRTVSHNEVSLSLSCLSKNNLQLEFDFNDKT